MSQQTGDLKTRGVLRRFVKGIFLGFAFGFFFVLLALLVGAFVNGSTNPALSFLANPLYMFALGELVGIGIEELPELEKD